MDSVVKIQNPASAPIISTIKKKKKRNRWLWIAIIVVILAIVALAVVNGSKEKAITVQTEVAAKRTITEVVQATGKIQPEYKVKVAPEVSGEIMELPFKEGAHVKKGQILAKIKPTSFEAQYEAATAQVAASKARSEQSKASRIQAEQALKRAKDLNARNIISLADLEQAQAQFDAADAIYNAAKYEVAASSSQLKQIAESLRKTTVQASMDGTITQLISQLGEKVVGTSQFSGTEMMMISDLKTMNAEVDVDENDVVNISIGDVARVTIDAFPGRIFFGTVIEIANSAKLKGAGSQDQSTNFAVKIRLEGFTEGELRPGMSCTAKIETETKADVVTVPIMAVTRRTTQPSTVESKAKDGDEQVSEVGKKTKEKTDASPTIVFIVSGGRAKAVPVKTGISDNSYVEILEGIQGGEDIIKGNYSAVSKELQDKSLVRIEGRLTSAKPATEKK